MPSGYGSSTTEERVVEMRIDNKEFEKGAKTTISTLEKLDKALNIKSNTSAIDDLADSVSKFDAEPMANAFSAAHDVITSKGYAIKRLIENLTDDIYRFGKKTVKELTVDQVSAGMSKYESLAESTQTIMAATQDSDMFIGKSEEERLKIINEYLDQLLWYSDETSYSFTDMTSNLSKFIAAGVELDDAVTAIMGVSSWGASAGAKPAEVARAMYNISQAMGAGSMKVVDWKSIENANMATMEFKENVLAIAAEMGKIKIWDKDDLSEWRYGMEDAKKEADLFTAKSFREGLSEGWFDTDVMTEVFKRYGEFAEKLNEFQVFGNIDNANDALDILDRYRAGTLSDADILRYATNAFGKSETAVENFMALLQQLADVEWEYSEKGFRMGQEYKTFSDVIEYTKDAVSSGWMQTFKYIFGDFLEAKELWSYVGDLFDSIFVASGRFRNNVLAVWKDLHGRDNLLRAFTNIVNTVSNTVGTIKSAIADGLGLSDSDKLGKKLADLTERFANFTEIISNTSFVGEGLYQIITFITGIIGTLLSVLGNAFTTISGMIVPAVTWFNAVIQDLISLAHGDLSLEDFLGDMYGWLMQFDEYWGGFLDRLVERFKNKIAEIKERWINFFKLGKSDEAGAELETVTRAMTEFVANGGQLTTVQKIANVIRKIAAGIGKLGLVIFDIASYASSLLRDLFNVITGKLALTDLIDKIQKKFTELIPEGGLLKTIFETVTKAASNFFNIFKKNKNVALTRGPMGEQLSFLDRMMNFFHSIGDYLANPNNIFGKIGQFFSDTFSGFALMFSAVFGDADKEALKQNVKDFLSSGIEAAKEFFDNLTLNDLFNFAKALFGLMVIVRLATTLMTLQKVTKSIQGIGYNVNQALIGINKTLSANAFLKIAVAITALSASLWLMSKIPADRLEDVVFSMIGLLLALALLAKVVGNGNKNLFKFFTKENTDFDIGTNAFQNMLQNFSNQQSILDNLRINVIPPLAANLIAVAALMAVLAWAVLKFREAEITIEDQNFQAALIALGGVAAAIIVLLGITSMINRTVKKNKPKEIIETFGFLTGMAILLWSVTNQLIKLKDISWEQMVAPFAGFALIIAAMSTVFRGAKDMTSNALAIGLSLILMAAAVKMLVKPIMDIANTLNSIDDVGRLIGGVATVAVLLMAFGFVISFIDGIDSEGIVKTALSMIIFAAAIRFLVKPLLDLSDAIEQLETPLKSLGYALGAMAVLAIILSALGWVCSKLNPGSVISCAIGLVIIAVAMRIMSGALSLFTALLTFIATNVPWESLTGRINALQSELGALAGLAGVLIAFAIAVILVGMGVKDFGIGVLAATAGAALFALGLLAVSAAIMVLSVALPALVSGLIATVDLIIAGADKLVALIGIVIVGIASVIIAKKLLVAKAVGTLLLAVLEIIAKMNPEFILVIADILNKLLDFLAKIVEPVVAGILNILEAIIDALIAREDQIMSIISKFFSLLMHLLLKGAVWLVTGLGLAITDMLLDAVQNVLSTGVIGKVLGALGVSAAEWSEGLGSIRANMLTWRDTTMNSVGALSDRMDEFMIWPSSDSAAEAGKEAGEAYVEAAAERISEEEFTNYYGLGEGAYSALSFKNKMKAQREYWKTHERPEEYIPSHGVSEKVAEEAGIAAAEATINGYTETTTNAQAEILRIAQENGASVAEETAGGYKDAMTQMESEIVAAKDEVFNTGEDFSVRDIFGKAFNVDELGSAEDWAQLFTGEGSSFDPNTFFTGLFGNNTLDINSLMSGFDISGSGLDSEAGWAQMFTGGSPFSIDSFFGSMFGGEGETGSFLSQFQTIGSDTDTSFGTGITENIQAVIDAVSSIGTTTADGLSGLPAEGSTAGWNIDAGIANGITDGSWMPIGAISELANSLMSGFSQPLAIASPSRKMAELAAFIPAGVAQGINQNASEAINSVTLLGDSLVLAMQQAMYNVGMIADGNFTVNPTIAPVVDMSNARNAGVAFDRMFSQANAKSVFDGVDIDGASITRSIQSKDIVAEIRSINDHMSELDANLQNLQLVLDTGALVGGIATKMDTRLGVMAARKGRGN
jgi:hypothetical protein